jgi:WD40-like Beta Propeller Repeat
MKRGLVGLWICVVLAGCTAVEPSQPPPRATAPAASGSAIQPAPAPTGRGPAGSSGVVAYPVCERPGPNEPSSACRIWVVNPDGTDAHQLVPVERDPEAKLNLGTPDVQHPLAWSPDGSQLYFWFERLESQGPGDGIGLPHSGLAMTDAQGSRPVVLLDVAGPRKQTVQPWCPAPVVHDNCQANLDGVALSPDGTRIAYAIQEGGDLNISSIVVVDMATGSLTRLDSTRTQNPGILPNEGPQAPCTAAHGGYNENLAWSPDGTGLVFTRYGCQNGVFAVDADGSELRELVPLVEFEPAVYPRWSPDGSRVLFNAATHLPNWSFQNLDAYTVDVYTVRPDGTDLQVLTDDGDSVWPTWTRDGRIVFVRWIKGPGDGAGDLWEMDADGANAARIDATVPALTAVGCAVCPYPISPNRFFTQDGLNEWLWQPVAPPP